MEPKILKIIISFIAVTLVGVSSQKYSQISDCIFHNRGIHIQGCYNVTFVCTANGNENNVFLDSTSQINCTKTYIHHTAWPGTIDFLNCQFNQIKRDFFEKFYNMHTFNISNVDLQEISPDTFKEATNITNLIVTQNRLEEIPALAFINAHKLRNLDFSKNAIKRIDSLAFLGLENLKSLDLSHNNLTEFDDQGFKEVSTLQILNLSHNQINRLESNALSFYDLLELDLANNNLSALDGHAFSQLSNLNQLNLSFNPISELRADTFSALFHLRHLNLRRINISSIEMGTFLHQQKLIMLDLSENWLKIMDFQLFHPIQHDLTSLRLANNRLTELRDFRNSVFLQRLSLDIQRNDFNCSYLEHFMESVNWEKIQMPTNQYLMDKPNIRRINCKVSIYQNCIYAQLKQIETDNIHDISLIQMVLDRNIDANNFLKMSLFISCFIILVFIILFVVLIRAKTRKHFDKYVVVHSTDKITPQNEYSTVDIPK